VVVKQERDFWKDELLRKMSENVVVLRNTWPVGDLYTGYWGHLLAPG